MTKPKTLRSAASMILVTTALAWGLPVRADDMRTLESEQDSLIDAIPAGTAGAFRLLSSDRAESGADTAAGPGQDDRDAK